MSESEPTYVNLSLSSRDQAAIKDEAVRGRPYSDRVSIALAFRLLGVSGREIDQFAVLDEIDYLEGIRTSSRTVPEQPFRKPPLVPLWHKHVFTARNSATNVLVRWGLDKGGNRDLVRLVDEIAQEHRDNPHAWSAALAHRLVVEGFEERTERGLTGNWLVFGKHKGSNYYLDLAAHVEGVGERADALLARLRNGCAAEFPFVFD
jgi:hypothetical protein